MTRLSNAIIQAEVDRILPILQADFEDCWPLVKRFSNLPMDAGIYALRSRAEILYIGKTHGRGLTMLTSSATSALQFEVPDQVRSALEAYAAERNYSIDFVMELALSQFLDLDGVTFDDCNPVMSPGQLREENEMLKYKLAAQQ
jgi:hypothetical protein